MSRALLTIICAVVALTFVSCHSKKKSLRTDDGIYSVEEKADRNAGKKGESNKKRPVREMIVEEARSWVGTPYRYGGESHKGVDCSGLVMSVFRDVAAIKLPRSSAEQCDYCKKIGRSELRRGDLVFFRTGKSKKVNHVGIYIGNGCMVHSSSSRGVIVSDLDQDYYRRTYHASGRVRALGD